MKRIVIKNTSIVAESHSESLLWGGFQIPFIRYADGALVVKFMGRKDAVESYGQEDLDPIYISRDGGETWTRSDLNAWRASAPMLPNGDRFDFVQRKNFIGEFDLPKTQKMAHSSREVYVHRIRRRSATTNTRRKRRRGCARRRCRRTKGTGDEDRSGMRRNRRTCVSRARGGRGARAPRS